MASMPQCDIRTGIEKPDSNSERVALPNRKLSLAGVGKAPNDEVGRRLCGCLQQRSPDVARAFVDCLSACGQAAARASAMQSCPSASSWPDGSSQMIASQCRVGGVPLARGPAAGDRKSRKAATRQAFPWGLPRFRCPTCSRPSAADLVHAQVQHRADELPVEAGRHHNGLRPASICRRLPSRKGGSESFSPKSRQRLVRREARAVRCNLEQDAVRLPEVEAPEVEAVYRPTVGQPQVLQPLRPRTVVLRRKCGTRRDHAAGAGPAAGGPARTATWSSAAGPPAPIA